MASWWSRARISIWWRWVGDTRSCSSCKPRATAEACATLTKERFEPRAKMQVPAWTLRPRREADDSRIVLHPQRYGILGILVIQLNDDAGATGLRKADGRRAGCVRVRAFGSPIIQELGILILRTGARFGAAPHGVRGCIV